MNVKELISRWKDIKRSNYNCISLNHYIANNICPFYSLSNIFYPILFKKELTQFTNVVLVSKGSGDSYYLVLINGKYSFFKVGFEPDCDGAYYYGHSVAFLEVVEYIEEFEIVECYMIDLLKDLNRI